MSKLFPLSIPLGDDHGRWRLAWPIDRREEPHHISRAHHPASRLRTEAYGFTVQGGGRSVFTVLGRHRITLAPPFAPPFSARLFFHFDVKIVFRWVFFFSFFFSGQSMECTLLFLLFRTIFLFYLFHPSLMALLDYLGLRKHHYRVKVANEVLHNRKIKTSEKKSAKLPGRSPNPAMSNLNLTPNANCKAIRTATFESFPTGCHEESWSWCNTVTAHPFCLVKCNRAWSREGRHSYIARTDIKSRRNPTGFGDVLVMNAGGTICRWGLFWKWIAG